MQMVASTITTSEDFSVSSLEAAAAAAAKINAVLASKGKLQIKKAKDNDKSKAVQNEPIFAEIEINNVPLHCRNMLTKRTVQDRISRESGAAVSTRGCYMNEEEKRTNTTGERSLYLFVQSLALEKVEKAVHKFLDIVKNITKGTAIPPHVTFKNVPDPPSNSAARGPGIPPSVGNALQEKVFVGLELAHPSFSVKEKLEGPGGSFIGHIRTETGASVYLRGRGSGLKERASGRESFENLYLFITHIKQENLQAAKKLCENLVQTIHVEYGKFQAQLMGGAAPHQGGYAVGPPPVMPQFTTGQPPLGTLLPGPASQAAVVTVAAQTSPLVSTGHPVSSQFGQPLGLQPISASSVMSINSPVAYPHLQRFQVPAQQPTMLTTSMQVPGAVPRQVAVLIQPSQAAVAASLQQPHQFTTAVQQPQLPAGMVMAPRLATVISPPGVVAPPQRVVTPQSVHPPQGIPVGVPPVTLMAQRPPLTLATTPLRTSGFGVMSQASIGVKAVLPPPQMVHLQSPATSLVQHQPAAVPLTSQPQALHTLQQNALSPGQLQQPPPQLTTQQLLLLRGRQEAIQQVAQQQVAAQQQAAVQQQAAQLHVAQQQAAQAAAQQRVFQLQVAQQQAVQQQVAQQQAAQQVAQQQAAQLQAAQQGPTQQQVAAAQLTLAQHLAQQRLQMAQQQQSPDLQQAVAAAAQQQQAAAAAAQQTIAQQIAAARQAQPPAPQHVLIQQAPPQQLQPMPQPSSEAQQQVPQAPPTSLFQAPPPGQLPPHSQGLHLQGSPSQPPVSSIPASQVPASQAPTSQAIVSQVPTSQALISQAPSSQPTSSEQLVTSQASMSQSPPAQPLPSHPLAPGGTVGHHYSQGDQSLLGPPPAQNIPSCSVATSSVPTATIETQEMVSDGQHLQQQQPTSQLHLIQTSGVLTQQMPPPPASIIQAIASSPQHVNTSVASTAISLLQAPAGLLQYPPMSGSDTSITPTSQEQPLSMRPRYDDRDGRDLLTGSLLRDEGSGFGRRRRFREDFELEDKSPKSLRTSEYGRRSPPYGSRGLGELYGRRRRFQEEAAGDRLSSGYGGFRHRERDDRRPRFTENDSDRRMMPPPPLTLSSGMTPPPKPLLSPSGLGRPGVRRVGLGPLDDPPPSGLIPYNAASTDSDPDDAPSSRFPGSPFDNGREISPRMSADGRMFDPPSQPEGGGGHLMAQPGFSPLSRLSGRLGEAISSPLDLSSPERMGPQAQDAAHLRAQALSAQPFWMARY